MLLEMRNYRAGLVQTPNQLRFAYEAIINAKNSELFKQESEHVPEQDSKESEKPAPLPTTLLPPPPTTPLPPPPTTNPISEQQSEEKELRRRIREEKKTNTMEQIKRIKDKQKEIANWSQQKVRIKFGILLIGVSVISAGIIRSYFL